MNVCMISGLAKRWGGVESVVTELSDYYVNRKINVTVFAMSNRDFIDTHSNYSLRGIHPYNILPSKLQVAFYDKFAYSLKVWRNLSRNCSFDIIHGHADNCLFPSLFRNEVPYVMTFHGTRGKVLQKLDPRSMVVYYAEKIAALKCDVAVACSNAVKNEITSFYGVKASKVRVLYNGVDVAKFAPIEKIRAKIQLNLPLNHRYVLWVGGDPQRKGLPLAMKAVKSIPNTYLIVVGTNGANIGNTIFLGRVSEQDLIAAYNAADLLIFPTIYEGFPVAPMEALSCGLPIVVSEESNMGEIITEGTHGYVIRKRSVQLYREKIEYLLNEPERLKQMSFECRNLAIRYSWEKQAEKYLSLYTALLQHF